MFRKHPKAIVPIKYTMVIQGLNHLGGFVKMQVYNSITKKLQVTGGGSKRKDCILYGTGFVISHEQKSRVFSPPSQVRAMSDSIIRVPAEAQKK